MKKKSVYRKFIPYLILVFAVIILFYAKNVLGDARDKEELLELQKLEQKDNLDIERFAKLDLNKEILPTVVNIICESSSYSIEDSGGSGTMFAEDGMILTNAHIIPHIDSDLYVYDYGCLVTLPNKETGVAEEIYWAYPLLDDELSDYYDLAFLEIYDVYVDEEGYSYGEYPKNFVEFDDTDRCKTSYVSLGEKVLVFGYPLMGGGYNLTITEGIVSGYSDEGYLLTSAKIDSGNSGGLAVDEDGCMLGVPSAVLTGNYESLGVIISSEDVISFIDDLSLKYDEIE